MRFDEIAVFARAAADYRALSVSIIATLERLECVLEEPFPEATVIVDEDQMAFRRAADGAVAIGAETPARTLEVGDPVVSLVSYQVRGAVVSTVVGDDRLAYRYR
jgi:hypothetical protein